jgi:error-prone DNA polymerase
MPQQPPPPFAELLVTTNFTFLRGGSHGHEFCARASELDYKFLGISDLHSLAGIVRFHRAAKDYNITPLIGCRISLQSLPHCSLTLFPTNRTAYGRLSSLLTVGKLRAPKGECFLSLDDLSSHNKDLLCIVSTEHSAYSAHANRQSLLHDLILPFKCIFDNDRLSLAISHHYLPGEKKRNAELCELSRSLGIPLVATNDVTYHAPDRRILQDVLTCIHHGCTIEHAGFKLQQNAERYLKPIPEILRLFRHTPDAVRRTVEIAEQVAQFSLDQLHYEYPHEICPKGKTPAEYLRELVITGARERYPAGLPKTIAFQIKHELELIRELNYEKYFLTCYDIVAFARSREILCQGRGAAANSAVCYMLGITAVDPAQIHLLFERFISRERNEPPDIDIDFEHQRREEVIQYIYNKYGRHRAALTAEVISYRTRSAIRDVGKVFGLDDETQAKLIRHETRGFGAEDLDLNAPAIRHTLGVAEILRSFPRHLGQHVGGFIISDTPLSELVPIENAAMEQRTVIEWDKDDIEELKMLKIDVLGLGMLSCIRRAIELVNQTTGSSYELYSIPREDKKVYDMICAADTIGVFQIESRAQMTMLPRLRPRCYYDLVVEVAIVRPGPIQGGMVHPYLRRRSGKETVSYPDERIRKVLEPTLGVPIFQEQVMELAVVAAGFTPGEADQLRRAMANWRKNDNALLAFRERLMGGMKGNGYNATFAEQIFEQIKGFGEYGFPQSHSASFALLVYVSAWLKCHHPAAFTVALLNSLPMGFYQPAQLIEDVKQHGVEVRPADVNYSISESSIEEGAIRLGLRLVKGLSKDGTERIAQTVREHGKFRAIDPLWRASSVSIADLKHLARADAFRSMGLDRQQALWQIQKLRNESLPLFETVQLERLPEPQVVALATDSPQSETNLDPLLPAISPQSHVVRDYNTVGLSLKAHPMEFLREQVRILGAATLAEFRDPQLFLHGRPARIAGLVITRQRPATARGTMFVTIEDETGFANIIVRPKVKLELKSTLLDSVFVLAEGTTQRVDGVLHLMLHRLIDITELSGGMGSVSRDFR